ncbi:MAG: hypothetical protein JWQ62_2610 [Lacunisphaera sp.]|nr:hypothetical protein [Lacunisphaera sp.]
MSAPSPYRVTLIQLKANALGLAPAGSKIELGPTPPEEIYRLAGNLLLLNSVSDLKAEPGILVQRGDKGWRIAVHSGRLCMHKSTSLLDEYWPVENARALAELPPFRAPSRVVTPGPTRLVGAAPKQHEGLRAIGEVAGLFVLGVGLILIGFWFGLPHKHLSDLPPDVVIITSSDERASIFNSVAGKYAVSKKPGEQLITITPDGQVSLAVIGKDGQPLPAKRQEQARAGRKGNMAVVVTKGFGLIAELPPDAVNVGVNRWRKIMLN